MFVHLLTQNYLGTVSRPYLNRGLEDCGEAAGLGRTNDTFKPLFEA